jgi:hypothetical protein
MRGTSVGKNQQECREQREGNANNIVFLGDRRVFFPVPPPKFAMKSAPYPEKHAPAMKLIF